jgi:ATP-dependent Clp protease protease subunit
MFPPIVIEQSGRGERSYDIYSRLLKDRIIFIGTEIDYDVSNSVIAQLMFLEYEDPNKDIILYINSPGGMISSGLAIYDTMRFITAPVSTICIGQAASMAAILLSAGTKGKRFSLPSSRIMIHQPMIMGGLDGTSSDIEIQSHEMNRLKDLLNGILHKTTGKDLSKIKVDTDRDFFMSATEAKTYGIVDNILEKRIKITK